MPVPSRTHLITSGQHYTTVGWLTVVASCVGLGAFDTVQAASDASDPKNVRTLEEVIVTAQKRAERLQDVPISISVMSGEELDQSTAEGVNDALSRVPGVAVTDIFLGGGSQLAVRGVTASLALFQGASPIAYYLDSVPFGFVKTAIVPDPNAYDLQRVEVLRGPQGTLYGASALNGVVRVLTHDADPDKFELKVRTSASSTEHGEENYRGDAAVNVPLVTGKLAARAVVGYQKLGGWIDRPNHADANDAEVRNARLKLNAQPTDQLSLALSAWTSRNEYGAPSTSSDNRTHPSFRDESIDSNHDVLGLQIRYQTASLSLISNTSYLEFENESTLDILAGTPDDLSLYTRLPARTFSQEVILSSIDGRSWRWTLGGIYRDSEDKLFQFLPGIYLAPTDLDNVSKSYAAFGELTRVLAEGQWELTAGLRYFEDDVGQREHSRLTGVSADQLGSTDSTFDATTPRFVVTWHPSDAATMYASYSQGFRSGSDQIPTVLEVAPIPPAKPDKLTNYELGAKASLADGRMSVDAAVYYLDWQDVQLPIEVNVIGNVNLQTIINGQSASGLGVDFAVVATPLEGLKLGANASWNDLTVDDDVLSGGVVLFGKGDRLTFSPEYTVGAFAEYSFPSGSDLETRVSLSANYTSDRTHIVIGNPPFVGDSMLLGNVSVSVESSSGWVATLFADNVNNYEGIPFRSDVPDWNGRVRPRTIGLQLEYQF